MHNAKLQKELFELKSLEPDEQIKEDFKNIIVAALDCNPEILKFLNGK